QEAAVGDLQRLTRQSMQRVSIPGDPTKLEWKIDTAKLIKDFDTFVDSPRGEYFRRSFQPEEFTQLRSDIEGFAGTPQYPTSARPPAPTFLPGRMDVSKLRDPMAGMQQLLPRQVTFGDPDVLRPGDPQRAFTVRPYEAPPPVEPQLRVPSPGRLIKDIMYTAVPTFAGTRGLGTAAAVGATVAAGDLAMYGLARLMISPQMRPMVLRMLQQSGGKITPQIYGLLGAAAVGEGRQSLRVARVR